MKNELSPQMLLEVRQVALDKYRDSAKSSYDSPEVHIARCWLEGLEVVLNKNGYIIRKIKHGESEME